MSETAVLSSIKGDESITVPIILSTKLSDKLFP